MWPKTRTINDAVLIGVEEGETYKLKGNTYSTLTSITIIPCELWNRILSHVKYKSFPIVSKVVSGLPEIQMDHEGMCKGCSQEKNNKNHYPKSDNKEKWILDIIHTFICRPMQTTSLSRYIYYASFIDDYSRKTWIYFLK